MIAFMNDLKELIKDESTFMSDVPRGVSIAVKIGIVVVLLVKLWGMFL